MGCHGRRACWARGILVGGVGGCREGLACACVAGGGASFGKFWDATGPRLEGYGGGAPVRGVAEQDFGRGPADVCTGDSDNTAAGGLGVVEGRKRVVRCIMQRWRAIRGLLSASCNVRGMCYQIALNEELGDQEATQTGNIVSNNEV